MGEGVKKNSAPFNSIMMECIENPIGNVGVSPFKDTDGEEKVMISTSSEHGHNAWNVPLSKEEVLELVRMILNVVRDIP